jgi:hypothetical protein
MATMAPSLVSGIADPSLFLFLSPPPLSLSLSLSLFRRRRKRRRQWRPCLDRTYRGTSLIRNTPPV